MRKNLGKKTYLYPMPVLIIGTYDNEGMPNAMNAAWGGISDTNQICICLSGEHKTVKNIIENKYFTVSVGETKNVTICDYVGLVSGNDNTDKIKKANLHVVKSEFVNAPLFAEFSFTLECKLISYDYISCHLFGEIVNVSVDDGILTNDKVDLEKFKPITFDPINHKYIELGKCVAESFKEGLKLK